MVMGYFEEGTTGKMLEADPLKDYFVFWDEITLSHLSAFLYRFQIAEKENDWQYLFEKLPILLIQHMSGGHGRWVMPQKALGSEYRTDFLIAERDSEGFQWQAVELESHKAKIFKKNGDFTQDFNHAINQIVNWRFWLRDNLNYARNERAKHGLGLTDIVPKLPGLIIIGRRKDLKPENKYKRRDFGAELNIKIHTYDWLYEQIKQRYQILKNVDDETLSKMLGSIANSSS